MKKNSAILIGAVVVLCVGAAGYGLGVRKTGNIEQNVSGKKILFYRNPMGLPDTSPLPKKDSMGMDYVPVLDGEMNATDDKQTASTGSGQVSISIQKVQKLGVKSEAATLRNLDKTIRAVGRVEVNEARTYTIAPKFEGWVERLYVNTTGQAVSKGQRLFDVYSPELISALREYALAAQGEASLQDTGSEAPVYSAKSSMSQLAAASLARLKNWGIGEQQIRQFKNSKEQRSVTFYAPVSGAVIDKKAVQGMRFMPGEVLYQIADLSSVWVVAEVAEQDIGQVRVGNVAHVTLDAYQNKIFQGKIAFISPTLNAVTRTVQVRVEMPNRQGLLKPAMFANMELAASPRASHGVSQNGKVLTVPTSAVIDSGTRQIVLVQRAEGHFEPRTVKLGSRSENYVEVVEGLAAGEQVVTSANFLIDAESNLKAALSGMGDKSKDGGKQ